MIRKKIQLLFETEVKVIINVLLPESCWEMDSGVSQRVKDRTLFFFFKDRTLKGGDAGGTGAAYKVDSLLYFLFFQLIFIGV